MGEIWYGAVGGADICEISEQWRWETIFGWWNWEEWELEGENWVLVESVPEFMC